METGAATADLWHRRKDGSTCCLTVDAVKVSETRVLGFCKDITKRKLAETALRESEQKYRLLAENATDVVWIMDLATRRFTYFSPSVQKMRGYTPEEAIALPMGEMLTPESQQMVMNELKTGLGLESVPGTDPDRTHTLEYVEHRKDGSTIMAEARVKFLRDASGRPVGIIGTSRDISDRKRAESQKETALDALRKSEEKHRLIVDNASEIIIVIQDGMLRLVNPSLVSLLGFSEQELKEKPFPSFVHPDDRVMVVDNHQKRMQGGDSPARYEFRLITKDGDTRWIAANVVNITWEGLPAALGLLSDITDRKLADEELREQRDFSRTLLDTAQVIVLLLDPQGRIADFNPYFGEISGYSLEEARQLDWFSTFLPPENQERVRALFSKAIGGIQTYANIDPILTKHRGRREIEWYDKTMKDEGGRVTGLLCIGQDVTDRKLMDEALRQGEMQYRLLVENSRDVVLRISPDGILTYCSPAVTAFGGYDAEVETGQNIGKYFADPSHLEHTFTVIAEAIESRESRSVEFIFRPKEAADFWVEVTGQPLIEDDQVTAIHCIMRDISDRKRSEDKLALNLEAQASMNALLALSLDGGAIEGFLARALDLLLSLKWLAVESKGAIFLADQTGKKLLLCAQKGLPEALGTLCSSVPFGRCLCGRAAESRAVLFADRADERHDTRYAGMTPHGHYCIPILSGERILGVVNLYVKEGHARSPWEEDFLKAVAVTLAGTIERKRGEEEREKLQDQLRMSQKMEAIGGLAGGIAHDFNNLLSVILSYAGFILDDMGEDDARREDLLEVRKAAERAANLTRQLLAFGRRQIMEPMLLDLNQVTTEIEKMLRRILGEDIDFVQKLSPDLGLTLADPAQIEQVLMNIVVNARDAMPAGGKLTIETGNVELDEEYAASHEAAMPGPYVMLAVTDSGCGMDEQIRSRIFEPFFTTKQSGKGTGLGLSTVYGIVKQSGGSIGVYSEPGKGTTFRIYLPRKLEATAAASRPPVAPKRSTGTETILVVEDEEAVRNLTRRILEAAGYTVLAAANGRDALLACERQPGDIHLVLTDVVMPEMSGKALTGRLVKIRPGLKVLYMSGYTDNAIVHHGTLDPGTRFIGKPFNAADLAGKVREVLDEGQG